MSCYLKDISNSIQKSTKEHKTFHTLVRKQQNSFSSQRFHRSGPSEQGGHAHRAFGLSFSISSRLLIASLGKGLLGSHAQGLTWHRDVGLSFPVGPKLLGWISSTSTRRYFPWINGINHNPRKMKNRISLFLEKLNTNCLFGWRYKNLYYWFQSYCSLFILMKFHVEFSPHQLCFHEYIFYQQ